VSFLQFLSILRARWKVAMLVLMLTVTATVVLSLVLPKKYTAAASIVLDVKPDPVNGIMMTGMQAPSYVATQVDILSSSQVAQRVVRALRMTENPEVRERWLEATEGQGSFEAWLAGGLQQNLTVKPSRESSVISVSFQANDPKTAALVTNAFIQGYLDTSLDLRVAPAREYTTFFDTRAKELRETFEKAQAKLSTFQREKGILASDERYDVEAARLNELSAQIVAMQALSAESLSRQAQVGRSGDQMSEVLNNSLVSGLKAEAARLQAKLSELESRLGERHPQVVEARANLDSTRQRIAAETQRVAGSVGVNNQIARQREAEIRAAFETQRQKLLKMRETRDELAGLQREVENAQKAYDGVQGRLQQTALESQATRTNVGVLNPATEPALPSSPKLVLNTVLSIVLGSMLAVGAVLLMELIDRRVRRAEDVVELLDLPVIGTMPKPLRVGATRAQMIPRRVLARLPQPGMRGA
jgi:succinoglycan biosynthesis transport protein ExoP